ncbi:NUDIX hydrolase [Bacillus carboniphilus]|uniref:NUDIX hydrolase n=1 Tax=Bacillus carboniphilus TaxID=86663 RepID=A0ABP3G8I4_9BACI
MGMIIFGEKEEGKEYIRRPAAYGVMFNSQKDKVAIIQTSDGKYFLPGGGIEKNETHQECLKREAIEETGMDIEIGQFIGSAQNYFYSINDNKHYLSEGFFYLCNMGKQISVPTEVDHYLKWIKPNQAIEILLHDHQSWAVNEALKKFI